MGSQLPKVWTSQTHPSRWAVFASNNHRCMRPLRSLTTRISGPEESHLLQASTNLDCGLRYFAAEARARNCGPEKTEKLPTSCLHWAWVIRWYRRMGGKHNTMGNRWETPLRISTPRLNRMEYSGQDACWQVYFYRWVQFIIYERSVRIMERINKNLWVRSDTIEIEVRTRPLSSPPLSLWAQRFYVASWTLATPNICVSTFILFSSPPNEASRHMSPRCSHAELLTLAICRTTFWNTVEESILSQPKQLASLLRGSTSNNIQSHLSFQAENPPSLVCFSITRLICRI